MTTSPHLPDMPDVVLNTILRKSDFRSILVLRKVCRHLRNFIDDQQPESHLEHVSLSINADKIELEMPWNLISVKYERRENGCYIFAKNGYAKREKLMEGLDFYDLFLNDLQIIMKYQKSAVRHFYLYFNTDNKYMSARLSHDLKSWNHPLPIKRLSIRTRSEEQVMSVFPSLDSRFLENVELFASERIRMGMIEIVKTDQWKNLKIFQTSNIVSSVSLFCFSHMHRVVIDREHMMGRDVAKLREIFLKSPSMKSFTVNTRGVNKPSFDEVLGESVRDRDAFGRMMLKWICEVPGGQQVIEFGLSGDFEKWTLTVDRIMMEK